VGVKVFGVLDKEFGVYYGGQGLGGEVASVGVSVGDHGMVEIVRAYVLRLSAAARFVLVWLYCWNLALTSLSMPAISCAHVSMSAGVIMRVKSPHLLQ
jgi:hypothetical protein